MPRSWSSVLAWVAFAAVVVVAVATSGLRGSPHPSPPHPSPTARQLLPDPAAARVARELRLRRGDLPAGFRPVVTRNRAERDAVDSIGLCGSPVPGDALRVARDRSAFADAHARRVRTDVAVYAPGGAARAVRRLQAEPASCARPVDPRGVELPSTLALQVRVPDRRDRARHQLVVLRRGDVLVVLAVDAPLPSLGPLTLRVARALAGRLGPWPGSDRPDA